MITKENIQWLAGETDDAIKLRGLLEMIDGMIIKEVYKSVDSYIFDEYLPDEFGPELNALIDAIRDKDQQALIEIIGKLTGMITTWVLTLTWANDENGG